jgi:hypothetical protein
MHLLTLRYTAMASVAPNLAPLAPAEPWEQGQSRNRAVEGDVPYRGLSRGRWRFMARENDFGESSSGLAVSSVVMVDPTYGDPDMAHALPLILLMLAQDKPAEITEIRLERTECLGKCPIDEVVLRADGTATYVGTRFVDRLGRHEGKVARADFEKLASMMESKGFFALKDQYDNTKCDQASLITTATRDGEAKRVRDYAKAGPEELKAIEKEILKVMDGITWEKAPEGK